MTNLEFKELCRKHTNMTEHDIERHINLGFISYTNDLKGKIEFLAEMHDNNISSRIANDIWKKLDIIGNYRIDFFS